MNRLKYVIYHAVDKECDGSEFSWWGLRGFDKGDPDDCPVQLRADSVEELEEFADNIQEVLKAYRSGKLPAMILKLDEPIDNTTE